LKSDAYRPAMNRVILAAVSAVFIVSASGTMAQPQALSTRDVANCRSETDLAICLLGVEARTQSFRDNPAFARAPEVLAQLDKWRPPSPDAGGGLDRAYKEAAVRPFEASRKAVLAALDADRRGIEPVAALQTLASFGRDIQPQSFLFGQIVTASGADLRVIGFEAIWDAYALSIGRGPAGQGRAPPPSRGLAVAALAAWEREIVTANSRRGAPVSDYDYLSPMRLADAFGIIGDMEAVRRLDRFERGIDNVVRLDVLTAAGRLDEAAAIATMRIEASSNAEHRLWERTWKLVEAAQSAKRGDLAIRVARHILAITRRPELDVPRAALVIAAAAPEPDAIAMAEVFDQKARATSNRNAASSAVAAVAAVATWTALGQSDRADALIQFWRPRGLSWPSDHQCVGSWSGCHNATLVEMLRRANRLTEGFDGLGLTAETAILADLNDGRGLSRLDLFLVQEKTPQRRELVLGRCVEWAISNGNLTIATLCAKRLQESASSRALSADEAEQLTRYGDSGTFIGGVYVAAERCLDVAAAAVERNEVARARDMLGCALDLWGFAPSTRWNLMYTSKMTQVGTALLKEEGRL
jgi:hypothetical protein